MDNVREMAAALEALADWSDEALAAGKPAKWVARQGVIAMQQIASQARNAQLRGRDDPHVVT